MTDRQNTNSRISSVNRDAANEWNNRLTSGDYTYFLTDANPSPTSKYFAFIPDGNVVISAIAYINPCKVGGDITAMTLISGLKYYIAGGFSSITISAGTMVLFAEA